MPSATPFTDLRQRLIQMPPMNTPTVSHHSPRHYQNLDSSSSSLRQGECGSPTRRNGFNSSSASPSHNNSAYHPLNPTSPPPLPFLPPNQNQHPRNSRRRVSQQNFANSSTMPPSLSSSPKEPSPSTSGTRGRCPQNDVMTPDEMLPRTDNIHHHRRHRGKQHTQQFHGALPSDSSFIFRRRRRSLMEDNFHARDCITEQSPSTSSADNNRNLRRSFGLNSLSRSSQWLRIAGERRRGTSNYERSYNSIQNESGMTRENVGMTTMDTSVSTSSESQSMNYDHESFEAPHPIEQSHRDQTAVEFLEVIENQNSPRQKEDYLHSHHSSTNSRQQATSPTSSPDSPSRRHFTQSIPPNTVHSLHVTPPYTTDRRCESGVGYASGSEHPPNYADSNRQDSGSIRHHDFYNQRSRSSPPPYYLRQQTQQNGPNQPNPRHNDDESWIGDVLNAAQMAEKNDIMNGDKTTTEDVLQELRQMSTPSSQSEPPHHSQQVSNMRWQSPEHELSDDQTWMYDVLQSKGSDPSEVLKLLRQQPLKQPIGRPESTNKSIPSDDTKGPRGDDQSWWHDVLNVKDGVQEGVLGELRAYVHRRSVVSSSSIDYSSSSHSLDGSNSSSYIDVRQDTRGPVPIDDFLGSQDVVKSLSRSQSGHNGAERAAIDPVAQEDDEIREIKEDLIEQVGPDGDIPMDVLQALGLPENFLQHSIGDISNGCSKVNTGNDIKIRTKPSDSKSDDYNQRGSVDSTTRERQRKLQSFHYKQSQHARFNVKKSFSGDEDSSWMEDVRQSKKIGKIPADILKALGVSETSLDTEKDHLTVDRSVVSKSSEVQGNSRPVSNDEHLELFSLVSSGAGEGSSGSTKGTDATSIEQDARGPIPCCDLLEAAFAESLESIERGPSSNSVEATRSQIKDSHSKNDDQSKTSSDTSQTKSSPSPRLKQSQTKISFHSQDSTSVPLLVSKFKTTQLSPQSIHNSMSNSANDEPVGYYCTKPNTRFLSKIGYSGSSELDDVYPRQRSCNDDAVMARAMQLRLEVLESMNTTTALEEKQKKKERKNTFRC